MNSAKRTIPQRPNRRTYALRRGRVSIPGARYFITLVTADRQTGLTSEAIANSLLDTCRAQHRNGDYQLWMATVMSDHLHLLVTLGEPLELSQVIAKFKSSGPLRSQGPGLRWQQNFYDHRVRHESALEPFARYTFLNPYLAKLLNCRETWPWSVQNRHYQPEFRKLLKDGQYPQPEWISDGESIQDIIEADCLRDPEGPT